MICRTYIENIDFCRMLILDKATPAYHMLTLVCISTLMVALSLIACFSKKKKKNQNSSRAMQMKSHAIVFAQRDGDRAHQLSHWHAIHG